MNIRSFLHGINFAVEGYSDFSAFYSAAALLKQRPGEDLYTYEAQEETQKQLFSEARSGPLLYYHPPFELLAFLPLTYLSYSKAYLAWVMINLVLLLAVPLLLLPYVANLRPTFNITVVLGFFAFFPIFISVYHGQDSVVLLLLVASGFIGLKSGRPFLAGLLFGFGLFKFHLVLPLMLLFFVRRQWRVMQGFLSAVLVIALTSLMITGWQGMVRYAALMMEINRNLTDPAHQVRFSVYPLSMCTLRGLLYKLFSAQLSDGMIAVISVSFSVAILAAFWVFMSRKDSVKAGIDLDVSLAIVVSLLVGVHVHLHDWSLLILPILLLSNRHAAAALRPQGLALWTLRLAFLLVLMTPVYIALIRLEFTSLLVIPLLVFAILLAIECRSAVRVPEASVCR